MHFPPSVKLQFCPQLSLPISPSQPTYLKLSAEREKKSAQSQTLAGTQENKFMENFLKLCVLVSV